MALANEPLQQKYLSWLFERRVIMLLLGFLATWFSYEVRKIMPQVREYNLVVHQQKLDMLDRLNLDQLVDDYLAAEKLYVNDETQTRLKERVDALSENLLSPSQDYSMLGKPNEMDHMILEQYFNGRIFTWSLMFTTFLLLHVVIYAFFNWAVDYALIWDAIEGYNASDRVRRKSRNM